MKTMTVREFMRGGYKELTDVTVISNHGRPVFTVFPYATTSNPLVTYSSVVTEPQFTNTSSFEIPGRKDRVEDLSS